MTAIAHAIAPSFLLASIGAALLLGGLAGGYTGWRIAHDKRDEDEDMLLRSLKMLPRERGLR